MKKLSIPEHISLKKEYMPGIGGQEARQIFLAALPGGIIAGAIWALSGDPRTQLAALGGMLVYFVCCYVVFSCPDGSQSIYTYLSRWVRFLRTQKSYLYKQGKEVLRIYHEEEKQKK